MVSRRRSSRASAFVFASILSSSTFAAPSPDASAEPKGGEKTETPLEAGMVRTFWGVRSLEQDPKVSDATKAAEWQAFIERSTVQLDYAKKAVEYWKNAAKTRASEAAVELEKREDVSPRAKIDAWNDVAKAHARDAEGRRARTRVVFWTKKELARLVASAEDVERTHGTKLERIRAWALVLEWSDAGPEARRAHGRIDELERQLFEEAKDVDRISRIEARTKLEIWQDVLAGKPTREQRAAAEARVTALEAEIRARAAASPGTAETSE